MIFFLSAEAVEDPSPTFRIKEAYPTLLDPVASKGYANMDRVGADTSYLYYMHSYKCNETSFSCRDIWRQSVSFPTQEQIR